MNEETRKQLDRKLRAFITRRKNSRGVPSPFHCQGGPWSGHVIFLHNRTTADIVVDGQHGRYNQVSDRGYIYSASFGSTVVWEAA